MKKFFVLFLALSLFGGVAFGLSGWDNIDVTVGLEFAIMELNGEGDALDTAILRPMFIMKEAFGNFELYMEMGAPFWVQPEVWLGVDLSFWGIYNLDLTPEGTLGLILGGEMFAPVSPARPAYTTINALAYPTWPTEVSVWLIPGVKYTHLLNGISFFGQVNLPLILTYFGDALDWIGLDFILGLNMDNGFGITLEVGNWLKTPWEEAEFFDFVTIIPFFETGPLYAELEIGIPTFENGMDNFGLFLKPEVRYMVMNNLQAFVYLPIFGLGSEGDVTVGLGAGVKFSF
ncbi:MAG: hypothetical protein FWD87_10060 [Spirochaetaceae bacterium]|nr:hypothetical protein [Spirochaetaceae bacterium]